MAKKFGLNDEVVVVIGSGAGGGTLGNELAQRIGRPYAGNQQQARRIDRSRTQQDLALGPDVSPRKPNTETAAAGVVNTGSPNKRIGCTVMCAV